MAQPKPHPGLMSHLANAMIPAVATMASGVANPGQPTETATGSTVITKATIAPLQSLTWEQLLTLVKAAHNPRFCGSLSVAQSILAHGATGDFCAFMAGLPTVVRQALPDAPDPVLKSYIKAGMPMQGNATIDHAVTDYLKAAFPPNPQAKEWYPPHSPAAKQAWLELMKALETVAPSATDRQRLCSSVVVGLMGFSHKVLAGSSTDGQVPGQVTMMMLQSCAMRATDQDRDGQVGYGLFGKSGSSQLIPADFWKQIFAGDGCTKTEDKASRTSKQFLGAMVAMAENIVYRYGY